MTDLLLPKAPGDKSLRVICAGDGCSKSFAKRDCQRIIAHAKDCDKLPDDLRREAARFASKSALSAVASAFFGGTSNRATTESISPSDSVSEVAVSTKARATVQKAGLNPVMAAFLAEGTKKNEAQRLAQICKGLMVFMTCNGLPASFLSGLYTKYFFNLLAPSWEVPSATAYSVSLLPSEASWVKGEVIKHLHTLDFLAISFDGWDSRRKDSIYTVTVSDLTGRTYLFNIHHDSTTKHDVK